MKQEKSCGCIVINDRKQVLLVHHNAGHWDFPKGHIEEGETEIQTAIREVKEETGIEVQIDGDYRYVTSYSPKKDVIKEVVYFLAKNNNEDKKPQIEEVSEVKWFSFDEAINKITYDNSRDILIKLIKEIEEDK